MVQGHDILAKTPWMQKGHPDGAKRVLQTEGARVQSQKNLSEDLIIARGGVRQQLISH
jgi:hypothetical protein